MDSNANIFQSSVEFSQTLSIHRKNLSSSVMIERKFHMSVSNCIFHGPGFPARMIEIYPKGWGLFLYLWRHEGGRMVLMPVCPFSLLFLLITIRDGHAEREESNYRVGEDIS